MAIGELINPTLLVEHKEGAEEIVELLVKSTQHADSIRQFMVALAKRRAIDPEDFLRSLKLLRESWVKVRRYLSAATTTCQALLEHVDEMAEEAKVE